MKKKFFKFVLYVGVLYLNSFNTSLVADDLTSNSTTIQDSVLNYGTKFMCTPYHFGSSGPKSFDCSGFTSYVYRHFGYNLDHSSLNQANVTKTIRKNNLQKGDLVFFEGRRQNGIVGHVGIVYEIKPNGEFDFLHASIHKGVTVSSSDQPYYAARFIKGGRVIHNNVEINSLITENKKNNSIINEVQNNDTTESNNFGEVYSDVHIVKSGENLNKISERYDVPVSTLKLLNHLKNNKIKKGMKLIINDTSSKKLSQNLIQDYNTNSQISENKENKSNPPQKEEYKTETSQTVNEQKNINFEDLVIQLQKVSERTNIIAQEIEKKNNIIIENKTQNVSKATHKVKRGETLFGIAKKYNISVNELKELNHLTNNNLTPGQTLSLISQNISKPTEIVTKLQPDETQTIEKNIEEKKEEKTIVNNEITEVKPEKYRVKKGETLFEIAQKNNCTVENIKQLNQLKSDKLTLRQILIIQKNSNENIAFAEKKGEKTIATNQKNKKKSVEKTTHLVKQGESLFSIRRKYGCKLDDLKKWNNITNDNLQIGQKLIIKK